MNLTKIITFVLLGISLYLGYFLYSSVNRTIKDRESISAKEDAVIEKLKLIREAEIVFQEVYGRYTSNWDSLINFVQNGQVPIIERREEIIPKPYGGEDVILHLDTLGFISARERIFKNTYNVNAADNGVFMGFKVNVGDRVIKNQKAYSLKVGEKISEPPFTEQGTIDSLASITVGDEIKKGTILLVMWDYQFNPNVNIQRLAYKPGTETKFEIFAGKVDKAGLKVSVIEVKDPRPDNPIRKESNEAKNRKPLRFGSRTDVSTSGNWE
jgi:hypothetical protein